MGTGPSRPHEMVETMSTAAHGLVPGWTLQDRLRKARDVAGMDQQQLADAMGVSRRTITNSEQGHVTVRTITVRAWALATGVDPAWLETGIEPSDGPDDGGVSVTSRYAAPHSHLRYLAAA